MGDGLLAIFPLSNPTACIDLLRAIGEAQTALARLNDQNLLAGRDALSYGIGVHVGDVMYGNIGSRKRLDFTVIGPAVNVASRLESLTKRSVLFSKAFVEMAGCENKLEDLGSYPLRGVLMSPSLCSRSQLAKWRRAVELIRPLDGHRRRAHRIAWL